MKARISHGEGALRRCVLGVWVLAASMLGWAGCSLIPEPQPDATRFFVLSTPPASPSPATTAKAPTVQVREVELANYIRARPLIVRRGDNEIEFRDFARWGEPLEAGIARVVREDLLARGAASAVGIPGQRVANATYNYDLSIRVLACEGAADGGVIFHAMWKLTFADAKSVAAARGDFRPTELKWDGKNEASLAAQLSLAVAGLAGDIAGGLAKAQ